jgi:3-oxoisoapionate decarboxylase
MMRRRDFLQTSVAATLAAPLLRAKAEVSSYQRLGLNSYCLRALKWRDAQVLEYAASLKLDGVFLQDSTDPEINNLAHWKEVGQRAKDLGLHIETGIGAVLPKDPDQMEGSREQLLLGIERAKAVGSPIVRCLHAGDRDHLPPGSIEQHRKTMVKLLRSIRQQTMDAGLKIAIENHKDLQAWEMREVIEAVGPEFVGSYLDTGNPVFVVEDPVTTVEVLAPYAVCLHLRDSVVYEAPYGAMVQWAPLGEGNIDFPSIVKHIREVKPDIYVYNKPITGRPPQLIPYLKGDFWKSYPSARAADFARFVALAKRGGPYEKPIVIEDVPGKPVPEPFAAAIRYQQQQHMEQGVEYAKKTLNLGQRWRT